MKPTQVRVTMTEEHEMETLAAKPSLTAAELQRLAQLVARRVLSEGAQGRAPRAG